MKKLFLLAALLLPTLAFCGEPLMLINPGRETFLNFPSAIMGNDKTVTVFLPEPAIPLHKRYPVVYLLGAIPKEAPLVQQCLDRSNQKAILVGINFTEQDLADTDKIAAFISRELVPYIDVNYMTKDEPAWRGVAALGPTGAKALAALLAKKELFTKAVILNGGTEPVSLAGADASLRTLIAGEQAQAAVWQQTLQDMNLHYGPDFVTVLGNFATLPEAVDLDYLFAPADELQVEKLKSQVEPDVLYLTEDVVARLSVKATLNNGRQFDYIPLSLRLSPPYLNWNAAEGTLSLISGAAAGKVKISASVDKKQFKDKIRLKK